MKFFKRLKTQSRYIFSKNLQPFEIALCRHLVLRVMSPEQTIDESHCSDNYKKLKNMTSDLWPLRRKSNPWHFLFRTEKKNAPRRNLRDDHYHIYIYKSRKSCNNLSNPSFLHLINNIKMFLSN